MAQLMEFNPHLQPAYQLAAITPSQAWDLEVAMYLDLRLTPEQYSLLDLVNLVNRPVEFMPMQ